MKRALQLVYKKKTEEYVQKNNMKKVNVISG